MSYRLVYITCKDGEEAKDIGSKLVQEKLAACANLIPRMASIYEWEGEIKYDDESILLLKTRKENFEKIEARLKDLHSYDCPCIVSFKIKEISDGFKAFLDSNS